MAENNPPDIPDSILDQIVERIREAHAYIQSTLDIHNELPNVTFSSTSLARLRALKGMADKLIIAMASPSGADKKVIRRFFKLYESTRASLDNEDITQLQHLEDVATARGQKTLVNVSAADVFKKKIKGAAGATTEVMAEWMEKAAGSDAFKELRDATPKLVGGALTPILSDLNAVTGVGTGLKAIARTGMTGLKKGFAKLFKKKDIDTQNEEVVRELEVLQSSMSDQNGAQNDNLEEIVENTSEGQDNEIDPDAMIRSIREGLDKLEIHDPGVDALVDSLDDLSDYLDEDTIELIQSINDLLKSVVVNTDPTDSFLTEEEARDAAQTRHEQMLSEQRRVLGTLNDMLRAIEEEDGGSDSGIFGSIGGVVKGFGEWFRRWIIQPLMMVGTFLAAAFAPILGSAAFSKVKDFFGKGGGVDIDADGNRRKSPDTPSGQNNSTKNPPDKDKPGKRRTSAPGRGTLAALGVGAAGLYAGITAMDTAEELDTMSPDEVKEYGGGIENESGAYAAAFVRKFFNELFGGLPQALYEAMSKSDWYNQIIDGLIAGGQWVDDLTEKTGKMWDDFTGRTAKAFNDFMDSTSMAIGDGIDAAIKFFKETIPNKMKAIGDSIGKAVKEVIDSAMQKVTDAIVRPMLDMAESLMFYIEDKFGQYGSYIGLSDKVGDLIEQSIDDSLIVNLPDEENAMSRSDRHRDKVNWEKVQNSDLTGEELQRLARTDRLSFSQADKDKLLNMSRMVERKTVETIKAWRERGSPPPQTSGTVSPTGTVNNVSVNHVGNRSVLGSSVDQDLAAAVFFGGAL